MQRTYFKIQKEELQSQTVCTIIGSHLKPNSDTSSICWGSKVIEQTHFIKNSIKKVHCRETVVNHVVV